MESCHREIVKKNMEQKSNAFWQGDSNNWSMNYCFRYYLTIFLGLIYKILFKFFPQKQRKTNYGLVICAIFKNEVPYMREWIEYHLLVGVEHFYLYNNNSTDGYLDVLQPYVEKGVVTLTEWPETPGQITAYKHWYENFRWETTWCSFLDLDEFFVPYKHTDLKDWLKRFKNYPLVLVYWKMFGTSGRMEHDENRLQIEQYTSSWEGLTKRGKLFYNTNYDIGYFKVDMMHYFLCRYGKLKVPPINQFGKFVVWEVHRMKKKADIQCNHYWSRAYGSYVKKHQRGSACWGESWKTFDKFIQYERNNTSSDHKIQRFLIELKLKMNGAYPEE